MTDTIDLSALSGLQQLRLFMEGKAPPAPIGRTVGFDLTELEAGRVVFEGVPTRAVYNPNGSVHGGWMSTLLDSACGCVVHSLLEPGQTYTTLEIKTVFHRTLLEGVPVRAEGKIVQMGRKAAFAEATLKGTDGKLYATATSTCIVMAGGNRV